ncbi:MAG: type IV secretory system conjugative DNA transfer family protein, partial [Parcubacteria group bacterium]|nr:type IV secretory system conjugative DNA transfer family protein [Parcubacteria group bacterium]
MNFLGETNFRNAQKRFGIKTDDRRRHVYLIGKTGMGKSTVLENMVIQD